MEEMKNNVGNLAQITANLEASCTELEVREKNKCTWGYRFDFKI